MKQIKELLTKREIHSSTTLIIRNPDDVSDIANCLLEPFNQHQISFDSEGINITTLEGVLNYDALADGKSRTLRLTIIDGPLQPFSHHTTLLMELI